MFVRILLLLALLGPAIHAAPSVEEILRKVAEQAEDSECSSNRNSFAYQRTSRVEYLNDKGAVRKNVVRVYEVFPENGEPVTRLLSVNGRPARDKEEKSRSAARETGEKSRTLSLSEELLSRFEFTYLREEKFAARPAWVLAFTSKSNAESEGIFDRLINAMTGTLWIDQEDYQLARADLRIGNRVSFFGGIAGAIDKMDVTLIQRRIEPAVWLGEAINIDFAGRKLFSTVRFRCFENCSDFRKVSPEPLATSDVAQVSEPAVSPISKSAEGQ